MVHLAPPVVAAAVAAAVWAAGGAAAAAAPGMVAVAVLAATVSRRRRAVAWHLVVAAAALAGALAASGSDQAPAAGAVTAVAMVLSAVLVVRTRERLEAGERELRELAHRDPLTGVGNYRLLADRLAYEIARHRRAGRRFALLLLDLDDFKQVNERYGHPVGDALLVEVGRTLKGHARLQDTVVRQGGDEFAVLAPETGPEEAAMFADRLQRALTGVTLGGRMLRASIGWAVFPDDAATPQGLVEAADLAERSDKSANRRRRLAA